MVKKTDEIFKRASIAIEYALEAILPTKGFLFSRHFFAAGFTTSTKTPLPISYPLGKFILNPSTLQISCREQELNSFFTLKKNIKKSITLKKFTKGGAFVTKAAFLGKIVKETGYSDLEWVAF